MKYIDKYIASIEEECKPEKPIKTFYQFCKIIDGLNINEKELDNYSKEDIEQLFIAQSDRTYEYLMQFASYFRNYTKWLLDNNYLNNSDLLEYTHQCDFRNMWGNSYDKSDKKEYVNDKEFFSAYRDASLALNTNNLWYATFIRAIWEGIYSEDQWLAIRELRASDVNLENSTVHIHGIHGEFDLKVTEKLCQDLIKLSKIDYWERERRAFLIENIQTEGKYPDSVFKVENRKDKHPFDVSPATLRIKLNGITEQLFGRSITARKLFLSGIAYRIKLEAQKQGMSFSEFMQQVSNNKRSPNGKIINKVLIDSGITKENTRRKYRFRLQRYAKDFD